MINPIALKIGPLSIHWYGISYSIGILLSIWIVILLNKKRKIFKDSNQIFDLAFWIFMAGVILGGRLGYVLFYNLPYYISNPAKIFAIWEGGMSFHGGLIATALVIWIYCKKNKINFFAAGDMAVIPGALALTFTRLANFVNRELVGRVIENPNFKWMGVDFGDGVLRYPSQLFQSVSALLLFLILIFLYSKKFKHSKRLKNGVLVFGYVGLYGLFRFIEEFWRQPDAQVGFILRYFTLGQLFSLLMLVISFAGLFFIMRSGRKS